MKIKTPALWWSNAHICILCLRRKNYPHRVLWRILNKRLWCTPIYSNLTFWSIKVPNSQAQSQNTKESKNICITRKQMFPHPCQPSCSQGFYTLHLAAPSQARSHLLLSHWFPVALAWEIRTFFEKTKNKYKNNKKKETESNSENKKSHSS